MAQFGAVDFEKVTFRSIPSSSFRATVLQNAQFITLTLVDRSNWHEYKLEVVDANSYAVSANGLILPLEIVSSMLKKSLELVVAGKPVELGQDTPVIDAELAEHGVIMVTLKCQVFGSFAMEFRFPLSPVEVDKFAVLEAQLQDMREAAAEQKTRFEKEKAALREENAALVQKLTNDNTALVKKLTNDNTALVQKLTNETAALAQRLTNENNALKEELTIVKRAKPYFSISADGTINANESIAWNGATPRNVPAELIALAADNKTVTIVRPGLYQVYVRITMYGRSNNNTCGLSLRVNGNEVAVCPRNTNSAYWNGTEVAELLPLRANDRLEVYLTDPNSNTQAQNTATTSRFWGLFLSDI